MTALITDASLVLGTLACYTIAGLCDYIVQADAWGWPLPSWYSRNRTNLPVWLSWLPADHWHAAQFIRNQFTLGGAVLSMLGPYPVVAVFVLYVIGRGAGFSLTRKILLGR